MRLITRDYGILIDGHMPSLSLRAATLGRGWNLPERLGLQVNAIREQQLKQTQSLGIEADAIGDQQQLKQTQSGTSSCPVQDCLPTVGEQGNNS